MNRTVVAIAVRNGQIDGSGKQQAVIGLRIEHVRHQHVARVGAQADDDRLIGRVLPERLAAGDGRRTREVAVRRRRARGPFERAGVPRIVGAATLAARARESRRRRRSATAHAISAAPALASRFSVPQPIAAG